MRLGLGLAALGLAAVLCLSGAAARDRIESEDRWATAVNTLKRKTRRLQRRHDEHGAWGARSAGRHGAPGAEGCWEATGKLTPDIEAAAASPGAALAPQCEAVAPSAGINDDGTAADFAAYTSPTATCPATTTSRWRSPGADVTALGTELVPTASRATRGTKSWSSSTTALASASTRSARRRRSASRTWTTRRARRYACYDDDGFVDSLNARRHERELHRSSHADGRLKPRPATRTTAYVASSPTARCDDDGTDARSHGRRDDGCEPRPAACSRRQRCSSIQLTGPARDANRVAAIDPADRRRRQRRTTTRRASSTAAGVGRANGRAVGRADHARADTAVPTTATPSAAPTITLKPTLQPTDKPTWELHASRGWRSGVLDILAKDEMHIAYTSNPMQSSAQCLHGNEMYLPARVLATASACSTAPPSRRRVGGTRAPPTPEECAGPWYCARTDVCELFRNPEHAAGARRGL